MKQMLINWGFLGSSVGMSVRIGLSAYHLCVLTSVDVSKKFGMNLSVAVSAGGGQNCPMSESRVCSARRNCYADVRHNV